MILFRPYISWAAIKINFNIVSQSFANQTWQWEKVESFYIPFLSHGKYMENIKKLIDNL